MKNFELGNIVYLKTDPEQSERMIVQYQVRPGAIIYQLNKGEFESWHYEIEFSKEKDILKSIK